MSKNDDEFARDSSDLSPSKLTLFLLPLLIIVGVGLWYALQLIQPPPQKVVVFSTGGEGGGYHAFGKQYQQFLGNAGIKVELQTSAGSVQNLQRLQDPKSTVSVSLLQGGIIEKASSAGLVSIGRMFYEPLWIFYKSGDTLDRIAQLKGMKIAVGPEGSGTRKLATTLLTAANISDQNATLLPITGAPAVQALKDGTADAVLLTFAPEAPLIQGLLRDQSIKLMSLSQANALSRIYPFLARVTLPKGVIDLEKDIPPVDVELIAPVAALVVSEDLHPALVAQLAEAASRIHSGANIFTRAGEFPRTVDPEFQMSADALRFFKNGPSFLQRYLPFWVANFLERMLVLLIPLATIAVPLLRGIPALIRWRVQRKLTYWYGRLDRLENGLGRRGATISSNAAEARELAAIADAVAALKVPRAYREQYYNLRGHIDHVRTRLGARAMAA